jgi:competence ComEA-like helix-hairpin-helix protein
MERDQTQRMITRNFLIVGLVLVSFITAVFPGEIHLQLGSSFPMNMSELCPFVEKESPLGGKEIACITPEQRDNGSHHPLSGETSLILGIPIDINKATSSDIEALPGIGPGLANKIIEYRRKIGYFKSTDQILNVKGIGSGKLKAIGSKIIIK